MANLSDQGGICVFLEDSRKDTVLIVTTFLYKRMVSIHDLVPFTENGLGFRCGTLQIYSVPVLNSKTFDLAHSFVFWALLTSMRPHDPLDLSIFFLSPQVIYEKVNTKIEPEQNSRLSPFSARGALEQTKEILTSTKDTTRPPSPINPGGRR